MSSLRTLALALGVALVSAQAWGAELDQDMSNIQNPELKGTVVLRVDTRTNQMSMVQLSEVNAQSEVEAKNILDNADFAAVAPENIRRELDTETGSSSWYWYWYSYSYNYSYYPSYYYYGYNYNPYYYCNYGYYNYYWYGSYSYRWW